MRKRYKKKKRIRKKERKTERKKERKKKETKNLGLGKIQPMNGRKCRYACLTVVDFIN